MNDNNICLKNFVIICKIDSSESFISILGPYHITMGRKRFKDQILSNILQVCGEGGK